LALGFGAFCAFHRMEFGGIPARGAVALALAALLAGASLGRLAAGALGRARPGGLGRTLAALAAVVVWSGWSLAPFGLPLPVEATAAAVGVALLVAPDLVQGRAGAASLCLGLAAGLALCSAGLAGVVGIAPPVILSVAAAAAVCRRGASEGRADADEDAAQCLLLAVAWGASCAALLRAYLPAARSMAYALGDCGLAAAAGAALIVLAAGPGAGRRAGLTAAGLAVLFVSLLVGFSFFLYPDLVFSEPALLQTPGALLAPARVFPVWVLALALGAAAGALLRGAPEAMAAGAGAAALGLMPSSTSGAATLVCGATLCAFAAACRGREEAGEARLWPVGAAALAALGLIWSAWADSTAGWRGLRRTLSGIEGAEPLARAAVPARASVGAWGARAAFVAQGSAAEFVDGNLVFLVEPARREGALPEALTVALGLGFGWPAQRVGLVEPASQAAAELATRLLPDAGVEAFDVWDRAEGAPYDVVIAGAGAFAGVGNPLRVLSREGLDRIRGRLASDGVLCLWLPGGRLGLGDLRRVLATVSEQFPSYCVFVSEADAVLVAGADPRVSYAALKQVQPALADFGFWDPLDLVLGFAADSGSLAALGEGAAPWRLTHPCRPRDLSPGQQRRVRPASLAALVQHRAAGPGALADRIRFAGQGQRAVGLRGIQGVFRERSRALFLRVGAAATGRQDELLDFLRTPWARLELFEPEPVQTPVRVAAALAAFGLREAAAKALDEAVRSGEETAALHLRLADVLAQMDRSAEALVHYRRAQELDPQSNVAAGRLTALLLTMGRYRQAAEALEALLQREPENVTALLMLARLQGGPLRRPEEAVKTLQRVLELSPDNAAATELLSLLRAPAAGAGAPEPPPDGG
jgi:tetratricopeptide (TPR) repeat protein